MRPVLLIVAIAGLLLAATSGAAGRKAPRALVQAAGSDATAYGELRRVRPGADDLETAVDGDGVSVRRALVRVAVSADGTGEAVARAFEISVLDGAVIAAGARRDGDGGGAVYGLRIDGRFVGDVKRRRTIPFSGGSVIVNAGTAALRVKTADRDIRVAVAQATARAFPTPTPSPSPSPSPSPKPKPTAGPTATSRGANKRKRKKAPAVSARLSRGGYAFPVFGRARVDNTFGAARSTGAHQGTDIFAPFGAPVVAVQDGRLTNVGTLPISGNRLWLITENGDAFFYAHLSAFSGAARNGAKVKAGTVLGFVGNTGDAEPTPPHVHFEIHPGGMDADAVDPYPIVTAWQNRDDVVGGNLIRLQQLAAATERPGALVTVRDFIAE